MFYCPSQEFMSSIFTMKEEKAAVTDPVVAGKIVTDEMSKAIDNIARRMGVTIPSEEKESMKLAFTNIDIDKMFSDMKLGEKPAEVSDVGVAKKGVKNV